MWGVEPGSRERTLHARRVSPDSLQLRRPRARHVAGHAGIPFPPSPAGLLRSHALDGARHRARYAAASGARVRLRARPRAAPTVSPSPLRTESRPLLALHAALLRRLTSRTHRGA